MRYSAYMQYIADLHLHSKYSRAVSQQMTLPVMAQYAKLKGLDILSASDFTHPLWFKEISMQLEEVIDGIYALKSEITPHPASARRRPDPLPRGEGENKGEGNERRTYFLLSTEISSIYKQGEKLRRIHNLVFAPSLEIVAKINAELVKRGCNLNADGRPIIGITSKKLLELILGIDERCFLIPCHVWTPHFGLYGSASGFDSIEEAFGELAKNIYGIETGLSSDPDMNWSIQELRSRSILSFSDAHSPAKMGREATVFELAGGTPTYSAIKEAIMKPMSKGSTGSMSITSTTSKKQQEEESFARDTRGTRDTHDTSRILYTIEFYPEEGKYHFSGHRNCKVSYGPEDISAKGTICPVCKKRLTEGVLSRVQQLAEPTLQKRVETKQNHQGLIWHTDKLAKQPSYVKLVPLLEIIAEGLHSTVASQRVKELFLKLCAEFGSEIEVLLKRPIAEIEGIGGERVAEGVERVRLGKLEIKPGYDGEYGKVEIWQDDDHHGQAFIKSNEQTQLGLDF